MARRIETAAGYLVGTVDRVARAVVWSLECGECGELIRLDEETFRGLRAPLCACGWKPNPVGSDDRGRTLFLDFEHAFDAPASSEGSGIHQGMRL